MDANEYTFKNNIISGLDDSFGNVIMEPPIKLKIKRSRRKHLKDLIRLKKLGVLGRSTSSPSDRNSRIQRRVSEQLVDIITILEPSYEDSRKGHPLNRISSDKDMIKKGVKRNSYNVGKVNTKGSSSLLKHPEVTPISNVTEERSSERLDSNNDYSNGHQGTRMDSPKLK